MLKFIHTSDLHLGKPFGRFPEEVRVRLQQARAGTLLELATLAQEHGASHILLAGDTFDQTTPAPRVIRQALNVMRQAAHVHWVMMPGNHDHANATELWRQVIEDAPDNVILALDPTPIALNDTSILLPAPAPERHPGRDLTDWFDTAETGNCLRIGLAHGSVTDFNGGEDGATSVIPPDRASRSDLDYLALGDWHGQLQITPNTWYSGAPEADGFKHNRTPSALLVTCQEKGMPPSITTLDTGTIRWHRATLDIDPSDDCDAMLDAILPPLHQRALTMFDLHLAGRAGPLARVALEKSVQGFAPDFLWAHSDFTALGLDYDTADLDLIDRQGALRAAAEGLAQDAASETLPPHERETAQAALSHLFALAMEA